MLCKWRETFEVLAPSVWDISLILLRISCWITAWNCLLSRLHAHSLPFSSSKLSSELRNFWNHLRTVRSHMDSSPHDVLILVEVMEALCPNLNSYSIRRRRSSFGILIIKGFVCFETIVILNINYKLLRSIYYLEYKLKYPQNGLLIRS